MASLTDSNGNPYQQARERLLIRLHDAGITPDSPLGVLLLEYLSMIQTGATDTSTASQSARDSLHSAVTLLEAFRPEMDKALAAVTQMEQVGRGRIERQELFLEREKQNLVGTMVSAVTKDLRTQVFHRIREQLPTQEVKFYREARWHAYTRLVMGGGILVVLGSALTMAATWPQFRRGGYCTSHTYINPNTSRAWCDLDDDTPHS